MEESVPDFELAMRMTNGDERAAEAFLARFERPILSMARHGGLQRCDARNVFQESLSILMARIELYDERRASFRTWFYAIVKNRITTLVRSMRSRREQQLPEETGTSSIESPGPKPTETARDTEPEIAAIERDLWNRIWNLADRLLKGLMKDVVRADLCARGRASTGFLAREWQRSPDAIRMARMRARRILGSSGGLGDWS